MTKTIILRLLALIGLVVGSAHADTNTDSLQKNQPKVGFEMRLAKDQPYSTFQEVPYADGSRKIFVASKVELNSRDVALAKVETIKTNDGEIIYQILVSLTVAGKASFAKLSSENIGEKLAILIDDKVVTAPLIRETISGGQVAISGGFTKEDAERIARGLNDETSASITKSRDADAKK